MINFRSYLQESTAQSDDDAFSISFGDDDEDIGVKVPEPPVKQEPKAPEPIKIASLKQPIDSKPVIKASPKPISKPDPALVLKPIVTRPLKQLNRVKFSIDDTLKPKASSVQIGPLKEWQRRASESKDNFVQEMYKDFDELHKQLLKSFEADMDAGLLAQSPETERLAADFDRMQSDITEMQDDLQALNIAVKNRPRDELNLSEFDKALLKASNVKMRGRKRKDLDEEEIEKLAEDDMSDKSSEAPETEKPVPGPHIQFSNRARKAHVAPRPGSAGQDFYDYDPLERE